MEIFGIGPLEFIFILLIAFVVLGPKDIAKTGRTIGRFLRKVVTSQWWSGFRNASREIRQLPYTLMREANIEEASKSLKEIEALGNNITKTGTSNGGSNFHSWTNPKPITGDTQDNHKISNTESLLDDSKNPPLSE